MVLTHDAESICVMQVCPPDVPLVDSPCQVTIKNYYEARKANIEKIVDNFCSRPQVERITVLYENASVVPTGPVCTKAIYKKADASIFERYDSCSNVNNYALTNDDDILIPGWSLDVMIAGAVTHPNSIVGSFGRRGDPMAEHPYSNPFGGVGENLVLVRRTPPNPASPHAAHPQCSMQVGAAMYPCRYLEGYRTFIARWGEDQLQHCDDIIFNRWIEFKFGAGRLVAPRWNLHPIQYLNDSSGGLHGHVSNWDQTRDNCVRWAWKNVNLSSVNLP